MTTKCNVASQEQGENNYKGYYQDSSQNLNMDCGLDNNSI